MTRYKERPLRLLDILGRFEVYAHQTHVHNTFGLIGRLKDEGRAFWAGESSEFRSWEKRCNKLWSFPNRIDTRRYLDKQELTTVLGEFIQEFKDTQEHLEKMLCGEPDNRENDQGPFEIFNRLTRVFQASIYAGVSGWIDDKEIGHLKEDKWRFWTDGNSQLRRWDRACDELERSQWRLSTFPEISDEEQTTALRKFIQEFEHHTGRMYQMLHGEAHDPDREQGLAIFDWLNLVFLSSVYAIVSGWIDDKQEENLVEIKLNVITGESSQEWTRTDMTVPKEHRRATKRI